MEHQLTLDDLQCHLTRKDLEDLNLKYANTCSTLSLLLTLFLTTRLEVTIILRTLIIQTYCSYYPDPKNVIPQLEQQATADAAAS